MIFIFVFGCTYRNMPNESEKPTGVNLTQQLNETIIDDNEEDTGEEEDNEEELSFEDIVWQQRINNSFTPKNCSAVERKFTNKHYQGKLIDTHIHIAPMPDSSPYEDIEIENDEPTMGFNVNITDYVCMMDYEGTSKVFGFFAVWEPVPEMIKLVNRTMSEYPDRFVPFIMASGEDDKPDGFPTVDAQTLSQMLSIDPGLFVGYGEIGLYARGGHGGPKGSPALLPDSNMLKEIYPVIRNQSLVVYFHLGEGQKESFERVLDANPDINFIWHGDQLVSYGNGEEDLSSIEDILYDHPNAYYGVDELYGGEWILKPEVGKEEFLAHFEEYNPLIEKDLDTWKEFIERHPDQVIWGTDRGWSSGWSVVDPEVALTLNDYSRYFIGHLNPDVQEKFAYKNAEKLINKSYE